LRGILLPERSNLFQSHWSNQWLTNFSYQNGLPLSFSTNLAKVFNENMVLAKTFRFKERVRAELRWEAFNMLNRVIVPATNVSAANFGKIAGQGTPPRVMQAGVKITY